MHIAAPASVWATYRLYIRHLKASTGAEPLGGTILYRFSPVKATYESASHQQLMRKNLSGVYFLAAGIRYQQNRSRPEPHTPFTGQTCRRTTRSPTLTAAQQMPSQAALL